MYIIFKVCLEYPQNIEEIKRSNDKKNTAQWKFSGDKHKSAHPINLGGTAKTCLEGNTHRLCRCR